VGVIKMARILLCSTALLLVLALACGGKQRAGTTPTAEALTPWAASPPATGASTPSPTPAVGITGTPTVEGSPSPVTTLPPMPSPTVTPAAPAPQAQGPSVKLLYPALGEKVSSQPVFSFQCQIPEGHSAVLEVTRELSADGSDFAWSYRAGGSLRKVGDGRCEWLLAHTEWNAHKGTSLPPLESPVRVLPTGKYYWRVTVFSWGQPNQASRPVARSEMGSFQVVDPWQDLLRGEINRWRSEGMYLWDLLVLNERGDSPYLVALFRALATREPSGELCRFIYLNPSCGVSPPMPRLIVYGVRDSQVMEVFGKELSFRGMAPEFASISSPPSGTDINGDDLDDLVAYLSTGSNCWACHWVEVYQVKGNEFRQLLIDVPRGFQPNWLEDIDGDGNYEVLAIDYRFELAFWCHACSPASWMILGWNGERYVNASPRFPDFYDGKIRRKGQLDLLKALEEARAEGDGEVLSAAAVELLMQYVLKGQRDEGWRIYKEFMRPENIQPRDDDFLAVKGIFYRDALPVINLVVARAFGFRDFGAENYLSLAQYPEPLRAKILAQPYESHYEALFDFKDEGGRVYVVYNGLLDFFTVYFQPNRDTGQCDRSRLQGQVIAWFRGLGIDSLDRLVILWNDCHRPWS
jgi:hypothetical protein